VLETDIAAARAEITSLRAAVAAQDGSLSQLQARVCGLEQQLQLSQEDNASKASLISQLQATIAARDAFIKDLEDQARSDALERRKLHNMVQELKGTPFLQQLFIFVC
jgi:hypothetical protein